MAAKVLFVDRDGTLIVEPPDKQVDAIGKVRLMQGVIPALLELRDDGYRFVMVSNQDGLGTDAFPQEDFEAAHAHVVELFASQGIHFDEIFVCPHLPEQRCECRKPKTALLTQYLARTTLDLDRCAVIGDRATDLELADNIGIRGFLVAEDADYDTSWAGIRDALRPGARRATYRRETKETDITVSVDLDSVGVSTIDSGIGFLDHMLEQIAKHGGFRLKLSCGGDLHVDAHHTVEDVSICLGTALREALGDKAGIGRYGFVLPMDESEASVSLDLSGRPYFVFSGDFPLPNVGELPTELVPHFFRSLSDSLGAALHINVVGENTHHMVEACFKAVGRSLRQGIQQSGADLPSTKGVLA